MVMTIVAMTCSMSAQDTDVEAIAKMRNNKADSLTAMMAKVYATQAAMNHPTTEARTTLLKAFDETLNIDKQDDDYKEGNAVANEFFKVSQDMKNRNGIIMNSKEFAQALLTNLNDTTPSNNINVVAKEINIEARRLIEELTALHKDSAAATEKAPLIAIKSDSLSQNMGRFYGLQMKAMSKQKGRNEQQMARLVEGFNNSINVDDTNKPLIDGRMLGNDFLSVQQNVNKQLKLNLNKEIFVNTVMSVLNNPKIPTLDEFNSLNTKTNAYFQETQAFARETSPDALAQKGLGKRYIENLMEKDPAYIQAPSGLVYKIITPGNGKQFEANDKIKVMYKGTHVDGKTFDESKEPVTFAPSQVVPGFREALLMMRPGAKMIAVLPQDLAYGARGAGQDIKPYETLIFEIETPGLDESDNQETPKADNAKVEAQTKDNTKSTSTKATSKKASTKKSSSKKAGKHKK